MATGDDAVSGGMSLVDGASVQAKDIDTQINATRDYIANGHTRWKGGLAPVPIGKGGTNATTASAARTALGLALPIPIASGGTGATTGAAALTALGAAPTSHAHSILYSGPAFAGTQFGWNPGLGKWNCVDLNLVGDLWVPNATAAVSSYTVAYINGDGRLSKGASSSRFKKSIVRDPEIPDVFAVPLASYQMRQDPDGVTRYGHVAEDIAAHPELEPFVVRDAQERPESFDMMGFLFARVEALHRRVVELEAG